MPDPRDVSKTQIDRLGEKLRTSEVSSEELRLLDAYRRSFVRAYEDVIRTLRIEVDLEPTGRPAKSTRSIIEKLHRESIRLSQIQDIAGCRVVVPDVAEQDRVAERLTRSFEKSVAVDRRERPSHGYRAVHVIAYVQEKPIEIQIRTALQHLWAEVSEKFSDVVDPAIKYGGGDAELRLTLDDLSGAIAKFERRNRGRPSPQIQGAMASFFETLSRFAHD